MPDLTAKPTIEVITQAKTYLEGVWSASYTDWAQKDTFHNLKYPIWDQPAHQKARGKLRPGRAKSIIDHAVDTYVPVEPSFHREPISESETHRDAANRLEQGLSAVFLDSALHEPSLVWKQIFKHGLLYGYMVREGPLWSEVDKPQEPKRSKNETETEFKLRTDIYKVEIRHWNPIRIRPVHPRRVLLDPEERQPKYAVKLGRWTAQRIYDYTVFKKRTQRREDALIFDLTSRNPHEKLNVYDWYTPRYHAFAVGHTEGLDLYLTELNRSGVVPFAHAFTGLGMEPTEMNDLDPSSLAVSLLMPVLDDIKMDTQRINAQHELLMKRAYANLGTRGDPAELLQQLAQSGIVQGEEDDYFVMPSPEVDGRMFQHGADLDMDIEASTYSRQLAGQRQAGVNTVGATAIYQQNANRKFAGPVRQLEFLASGAASDTLRIVDAHGSPIGARGKEIRPTDIFHTYHVDARFEARDPVFDLQNKETGMREFAAGLIDWRTYHEDYRRTQDIAKVRKGMLGDMIRQHPVVAAKLAAETNEAIDADINAEDLLGEDQAGGPSLNGSQRSVLDTIQNPGGAESAIPPQNEGLTGNTFRPDRS